MRGEAEAIVCNPPGASDDPTDVARCLPFAFPSGSSTTLIQLPYTECWYMVTADQSCVLRGGGTGALGPAIVNDWPIWQYSYHNFWASANADGYVRVRGLGTSGTIYFYRSNR